MPLDDYQNFLVQKGMRYFNEMIKESPKTNVNQIKKIALGKCDGLVQGRVAERNFCEQGVLHAFNQKTGKNLAWNNRYS